MFSFITCDVLFCCYNGGNTQGPGKKRNNVSVGPPSEHKGVGCGAGGCGGDV